MLDCWGSEYMGEYVPVIEKDGTVRSFINCGADFISVTDKDGAKIYFCLFPETCYDITKFVSKGVISLSDIEILLYKMLDTVPTLFGYTAYDLDHYVGYLARRVADQLNNRKVLLSYSGGKDSTVSLIVLLKLMEHISFDLHVSYVYVPYLESERNLRFIDHVAKKLNIDIEYLEADRNVMKKALLDFGLPYRGFRWCTYQKIKPIRRKKKELQIDYEVVSDRISETFKRFKTLIQYAMQERFTMGKQFRPTYIFTILDVVKIVRENDLLHPEYIDGSLRVSCALCPYRAAPEINMRYEEVEDSGFIETVLKEEFNKWYRDMSSFEEFLNLALWRYHPEQAKKILSLRRITIRESRNLGKEDYTKFQNMFKSIWIHELPQKPIFEISDAIKIWKNVAEDPKPIILNPPWKTDIISI